MLKNTLFYYLLFLISVFASQDIHAQLSKKHYLPPITSDDPIQNQYIYISTPKDKNVAFKITPIGRPSSEETKGIVSNSSPFTTSSIEVGIQLFQESSQTATIIENKGYIIEADDVIYVSVRMISSNNFQAAAIVSKGNSALGTNFRMGGFTSDTPRGGHLNFISVMATEDNTNVTFDDFTPGIKINNYVGSIPFSRILNEGESFIVSVSVDAGGNPNDLLGTLVNSDKPVVVNSGSATGSFYEGSNGRDYGIDQIVDASKIGTKYIFVKGEGQNGWENVLIVAHQDNTEVKVNNSSTLATLNKGQWYVIEGNSYNTGGNLFVETSKPTFAYQGVGFGNNAANQGLFFVPPLSCENRGKVDNIPNIEKIGGVTFTGGITIVTNTSATVTINGQPISSFTTSGPNNVTGNPDYVTYKVTNLTGNVSVESSGELYCAYFNQNGAATSGSFYSGFPSAPEINFETTVSSLGSCIPNVTLQAANTELFDSYKWEFYNETTMVWDEKSTVSNYKPLEPGRYKLTGLIDCTGATFESIEIPVSICPDDFDGDLIIDNLDVDIDNDGILNCDESLGNATLNILNSNAPSIIFKDNSTNNTIVSSTYIETETTNSFTGTSIGNFESTINPATNSNLNYLLKFNQNINFRFTQNIDFNHIITEGEFFILKINPNSKNITLLDPDDQLLIDTNFDGEFESEVTYFSASEIHFKYKSNTTGAASTFEFLANQVDQIDFTHQSTGITATSTFSGNIKLTCFALDSDGDGIENMFDIDSDNDGIPDIFEASSPRITLLNTDANQDGLDDAFNGIITLEFDTDRDGIPNHLDVDSDNDGIFDLVEAGHGNLDANNDGILDNVNASTVGINGLLNALETVVDAKVLALNYTIADTDADNIFNFLELDADNDDCFDVIEAGFTGTNLGILVANPFAVSANGKVINNSDGYTAPSTNYITSAPIILNTPFNDFIFCENNTDFMSIDSTADSFQWEISTDNSTWNTVTDNAVYNGSTTNSLQISNPSLAYNNYKFRVVLNRTGNTCTETSNEITLIVNPLPILKPNPELEQCISANDNNPTVNLTTAQVNISETSNATFEYYKDAAATNQITNPTSYPVQVNATQSVFVKVISDKSCAREVIELIINVGQTPDNPYNDIQTPVCDDFLDADGNDTENNSDIDTITNFYLDKDAIIASINPPNNTEVYFYENADDRNNTLNEIDITNYRNNINKIDITTISGGIQFPIYYKILSTINNNCQGLGEFYLQINTTPSAAPVLNLELCDDANDGDATNGIVQTFDLESQTLTILGTQNPTDFKVTYHLSAPDANSGNSPLTSLYTNTIRDLQTIFVRVTNLSTNCFTDHTTFNLIIHPLPIANFVQDIEVCDDNSDGSARNGFSNIIDLESQTAGILGTQDATIYKVTYHRNLIEAQSGINAQTSPFSNTTANRQTIYVRVFNADTQCANGISNFDVIINPEPTFETISNLSECDNNDDFDDANSIIQTIDLDGKIPEILGASQDPDDFNVTFHASKVNATSGDAPISSPYENLVATETIFVRIQNKKTGCINDDASFDVIVNALPDFTVTTPQILCLNDLPLNSLVENPRAVYTFEWKNANGTILSTDDNINVTTGGTYTVTATTTNGTNCSRTETIVINESNIATLESSFITIIDESNNIGSENNLSISINTIDNDLGPGDYQFAILNTDDNTRTPFAGFQDEPLFENLEGGIYKVIVNDKNGCSPDATLLISVIQFPKFFTPNSDGDNDTWVVKGANKTFYPNSSINIFNRYGKLVAQLAIDGQGWDGTYGGKILSSDDYWFNITLIPADITKPTINKKGNFSLLRK